MTCDPFVPVWPETTVFWGAGATASLGFSPTGTQATFLRDLGTKANRTGVEQEVRDFFRQNHLDASVAENMSDLLIVLGADDEECRLATILPSHRDVIRRRFRNLHDDAVTDLIVNLRHNYDFDALRLVIGITPYDPSNPSSFLVDLYNVLDMHLHGRLSFNVKAHEPGSQETLSQARLQGARNCLVMLVGMMLQGAYLGMLKEKRGAYQKYIDFSYALAELMQEEGLHFSRTQGANYHKRSWYLFSYALISMNFDPVLLWLIFNAHREVNDHSPPQIGCPCRPLKVFNDLGNFVATRDLKKKDTLEPWYPCNETALQRVNDPDHFCGRILRLGKLYFPHGCYCWRECPSCGKLIAHLGDDWDYHSPTLFPPMPLQTENLSGPRSKAEEAKRSEGRTEVLQCSHCGALTYAYHTQPIMQTLVKGGHPSFLEEIARDVRACLENTRHVVLLGYSLPPDDMTIRTLLVSRSKKVKRFCTVVVGHRGEQNWILGEQKLAAYCRDHEHDKDPAGWGVPTIRAAMDLFGKDRVRAFTGGIPQVFESAGDTKSCVRELLYPTDFGCDSFCRDGVVRK